MKRLEKILALLMVMLASRAPLVTAEQVKESPVQLVVNLTDGSRLIGETTLASLPLRSEALGKLDVPLDRVASIKFSADHESVTVTLQNGDRIQAGIGVTTVALKTVFGLVAVPLEKTTEIQVRHGKASITGKIGTVVGRPFALQFDGSNSGVSIPGDNALACNPITIEFWLKGTGDGADHQVMGNIPGFAQQGGWDFDVYRNWIGRALFYSYDSHGMWGGVAGPTYDQVFDGHWHYFALIANDAVWHMYFDGVLADAYTENMRTILPTTYNLTIGHRAWTSAPVLPGLVVDELRISSVVRYTDSFIPPKTYTVDPDTVVYWRFNEGGGTTVSDSSGNNHTAVLCGSPVPAWIPGVE